MDNITNFPTQGRSENQEVQAVPQNVMSNEYAQQSMPQYVQNEPVAEVAAKTILKATSISDLQKYAHGAIVELPEFGPGQPFYARIKRPSMLEMATDGRIPNQLLVKANQLFGNGTGGLDLADENMLREFKGVLDKILEATLLEPSLQDIRNAGIELSDQHYMSIFGYVQNGVRALETFRNE